MLTLSKCRQLLGAVAEDMTDAQVEQVRDEMYAVARLVLPPPGLGRARSAAARSVSWRLVEGGRREALEERAGILEFDAGLSQDEAERAAFVQLLGPSPEN